MAEPVILDTARRHGVSDATIKHALDNAWTVVPDQGAWDLDMYLGPGSDGAVYEVGVAYDDEGHLIVVQRNAHASHVRATPRRLQEVTTMPRSLQEILDHAEELADHVEENPPDPADMVDATTLRALRDAVVDRARAEEAVATAVESARAAGHTWPRIGTLLGTSGEAARQRYGQGRATKSSSPSTRSQKQSGKNTGGSVIRAESGRFKKKGATSKQAQRS